MVNDWPCKPIMRGTQGPFKSTSSKPTFAPWRANAKARFTVVMLFPKDTLAFNPDWAPTGAIRMGEAMGSQPA